MTQIENTIKIQLREGLNSYIHVIGCQKRINYTYEIMDENTDIPAK